MKKCPYCSEDIQEEAIKCKHCGEFLKDTKRCDSCNAVILPSEAFCPACGIIQSVTPVSIRTMTDKKDKTVAALLAIFLGGLGIHKFYLKRTMMGIMYLIFFWTFIPLFIGFIEGLIFLTMDEKQFIEKYCTRSLIKRI